MAEIEILLDEYDENIHLNFLDQAYYNSLFVLKDNAEDIYKDMLTKITGTEIKKNTLTNKKKIRYVMISKRLGLKYPKEWEMIE